MEKPTMLKRIIMALLTLLVITYVIYVVCRASFTQVKTIVAKETVAYQSISCDCFIIHDETLIEYNGDGVISYTVNDGDKVSVNETVAGVFDSATSAGTKHEIERLKKKVEALRLLQTNSETFTKTPDEIDKNICDNLMKAAVEINTKNFGEAEECADDALHYINERQLITGKAKDFSERISQLEDRLNKLEASDSQRKKSKEIKAKATGYFVSSADGYENLFTVSQVEEILPEDIQIEKLEKKEVSDHVIGKTIGGVYWYAACPVSSEDALKIKNASSLMLDIPVVSNEKIRVELHSINQASKSSDAVVILKGTFMNDEMAALRKGNFSIIVESFQGIYIPKSAVHDMELSRTVTDDKGNETTQTKSIPGVYIKIGEEVAFRQIIPIYSGEDYVISDSGKDAEAFSDDVGIVQVYDDIIVEGANLYNGKIIRTN